MALIDANAPQTEPERQRYYMDLLRGVTAEREAAMGRPFTFHVETFGCQMNARDSEKLIGILVSCGMHETESERADLVLYNTCTVRDNADQRVYGRLGVLSGYKKENPDMLIGLCGCMAQEPSAVEKIRRSYGYVDLVFGTHNVYALAEILYHRMTSSGMLVEILKEAPGAVEDLPSERKYPFKSGVNVSYGCDNYCTYCIVPMVRGRERSRRAGEIVSEVERLATDGVVEVMLLGQNVNSYGHDLGDEVTFSQLLRRVEQVDGIRRIRFMTSHPKDLSPELIETMAQSEKICRHLHLPLQSGSTEVLRRMNRRYTKEQYLELADRLKEAMPDLALTTDIIVGFPGETEEDFLETMDVVRRVGYSSAFTFQYSIRTGTPAATWEQVPADVVTDRFGRLLKLVQEKAAVFCAAGAGQTLEALVEEADEKRAGYVTGRLGNNLMVHFPGDASLIGSIVPVHLDTARGFYYMGTRA
ncbi:MAG: tRNA (N6-isopentenyl adenosine(37)-C2)-methylthiotransferase MiaB [Lachnospiraceae bacterium]|nr:tRNA (N6-isopentenyl adenosine(37)-C2)-methylthiotransferase MiaB [Lachnospiraceae bacterium]